MKLILQLLIVALLLNACYRAASAAWRYYEFKDAVEQVTRFGGAENVPALTERILELAEAHEVPLEPVDLSVGRDGTLTTVSAAYFDYVELVPRLYTREHLFEVDIRVTPVRPLTVDAK